MLALYIAFTLASALATQYKLAPLPQGLGAVAALLLTGTPVLLMSAYAVAARSEGAQPASEPRMLEKPFTGAQLLEQVRLAVVSRPGA